MVRQAHTFEKDNYQNLSMNTHDQKNIQEPILMRMQTLKRETMLFSLRKMRLILSLVTFLMARIHLLLGN